MPLVAVIREIWQRCTLSRMLYSLAIEPKLHFKIEGLLFPHNNLQHHISAFANVIMIMVNGQYDINSLVAIVEHFGSISSANINCGKSDALAVGKWEGGIPSLLGGLTWKKGGLKYLGVFIVLLPKRKNGKGSLKNWWVDYECGSGFIQNCLLEGGF